jgi:hypothetical protein
MNLKLELVLWGVALGLLGWLVWRFLASCC